jgi:hypothetical protein
MTLPAPRHAPASTPLWHARAMNLADERVRERLALNGPLGAWKTLPGTHSLLFDDSIRFDADGGGEMCLRSALGGELRLRFRWRSEAYGVLGCQVQYDDPVLSDSGEPEEDEWSHIPFFFEQHASDTGSYWVMRQRERDGFWELMLPLVPA